MDARAIIAKLRRGEVPDEGDLTWFAMGLADGRVSDAQAGAFAMGVCLSGLGQGGRVALTRAMRDSGRVLHWQADRPVIDKHSTGGVGDCVSLLLAPALAACGACVPMISGRGLGHTGGTLDKMEAIPGVVTALQEDHFRAVVAEAGCAIVSASADIAPADKRLYAVRDVTATVESLDLITASILSKKLAAGVDRLVLDVKCGSGAFMKSPDEARALAQALVQTANAADCATTALVTNMDQPLAPALGNALEVAEVMQALEGRPGRLADLTIALGAELLALSDLASDRHQGAEHLRRVIASGEAAEAFGRMVYAMGGPVEFTENWARFLPEAPVIREIPAPQSGRVSAMDGEALGLAVVALGGGRQVESDVVNPAVGLSEVVSLGDHVDIGQPLARVHAARESAADAAVAAVQSAITLTGSVDQAPLVMERIT